LDWNVPVSHAIQAAWPVLDWNVPVSHAIQAAWPVLDWNVPVSHAIQDVLLCEGWNVPVAQILHMLREEYVPAAQAAHVPSVWIPSPASHVTVGFLFTSVK